MAKPGRKPKSPALGELKLEVERIINAPPPPKAAPPPGPPPEPAPRSVYVEDRVPDRYAPARDPFGAWLLKQKARTGFVGQLATAAAADRAFPKAATPDEVRKRLNAMGADGEMFEAVDDAELDWLAL